MTFQRHDHKTCPAKLLCEQQETAAEGFLETHSVRFGPYKLHAAGGDGADRHRSLAGMPAFLLLTYCSAWGDRRDLGEDLDPGSSK